MQKTIASILLIMLIVTLSGCANAIEGAGEDVEGWGQWMQESF